LLDEIVDTIYAVGIVNELQPLTGGGQYQFPTVQFATRPMSNNTINAVLRRLGYARDEMKGQGFRAMARTILDEVLGYRVEWIEHRIAHEVKDHNGRRTMAPPSCTDERK
jgi:hypothetical protein